MWDSVIYRMSVLFFGLPLFWPTPVAANFDEIPTVSSPILLVVVPPGNGEDYKKRQHQFYMDLRLTIDEMSVVLVPQQLLPGSVAAADHNQIMVRTMAQNHGAAAAVWVEIDDQSRSVVKLLNPQSGEVFWGLLAAESTANADVELALTIRALLTEGLLLPTTTESPKPSNTTEPPVKSVATTAANTKPSDPVEVARIDNRVVPENPPTDTEAQHTWNKQTVPLVTVSGGVYDAKGPTLHLGIGVANSWHHRDGWLFELMLTTAWGPLGRFESDDDVRWMVFQPFAGFGYSWRSGNWSLGPVARISIPFFVMTVATFSSSKYFVNFYGELAWKTIWWLNRGIGLLADLGLGVFTIQDHFRVSAGSEMFAQTPRFDWRGFVGVVFCRWN